MQWIDTSRRQFWLAQPPASDISVSSCTSLLLCCTTWFHHTPQLQEYDSRHRRLQQEYQPLVARLPQLQQQLPPEQLLAAAEFAASQGMQEPLSQVG
jgi:hypothetical protein